MALTRPKYSQIYDSDFKNSARVATSTSVTLAGAAPDTVDDIPLSVKDRVLVRAQSTESQNGIYVVTVVGTGNNGTWVRAQDADTALKLTPGTSLSIEEGTTLAGKSYRMTSTNPIVLGTTPILWTDVSGGGGAAGGFDGQIQYNNTNAFNGSTYFWYNDSTGTITANAGVASTTTSTGTIIVDGGAGISGAVNIGGDLTVTGSLTVNGTTTTINATTLSVDDKNIELGSVASPDDTTASGGGITLKGATDKTILWSTTGWTSSEDWNLVTGKQYEINGTAVLSATALGSGVVASSLTSVGTLTGLTVSGTTTLPSLTKSGTTGVGDIGQSNNIFATVYATTFSGVSTTAKYADLAEKYSGDNVYPAGTVVVFGGNNEITTTTQDHDTRVAGVISTDPAYLMNSEADGLPVAMTGRVPCLVQGPVNKGDVLVTSTTPGVAQRINNAKFLPGCTLGKALEAINTNTIETIEVVVGRF